MTNKAVQRKKKVQQFGLREYFLIEKMIEDMNEEIAVVLFAGKTLFVRLAELERPQFGLYQQTSIKAWLAPWRYLYGSATEPKTKPAFDVWLQSDKANRFEDIVFDPAEGRFIETSGGGLILNRFAGLAPDIDLSKTGTYSLFRRHLEENVCRGDPVLICWLWDWIAQIIQQPEKKSGLAVVIRGDKGTGKSVLSNVVAKLVGECNSVTVDSSESLMGRFNGHLADALLIQVEEGYHAGNPAHEARLKNLITGHRIHIERKGHDAYTARHFGRIMITSNSDHVVPATGGERRFLCFDILPTHKQDAGFFGAMLKELDEGGYAELFRDLSVRDLSARDWSKPPMTTGLATQISQSLKQDERWWADLLESGTLAFTREPEPGLAGAEMEWSDDEPFVVPRAALYESFRQFVIGYRSPPSPNALGRFLRQACPDIQDRRTGPKGNQTWNYVLPARLQAIRLFEMGRPGLVLQPVHETAQASDMVVQFPARHRTAA